MRESELYKGVTKLGMPDFEETRKNIVSSGTKKLNFKIAVAVAACIAVAISTTAVIQNTNKREFPDYQETANAQVVPSDWSNELNTELATEAAVNKSDPEDVIVYNKLNSVAAPSLACNCRQVDQALMLYRDIIKHTSRDMNERHYFELYILPDELKGTEAIGDINNYTELHTCQISLNKPDSAKKIIISFSSKGEPLRDCIISTGYQKYSTVSGQKMYLNGNINDGMCIATFEMEARNGNKLWFDIEFCEVSEDEMLSVLREIVRHWNLYGLLDVVPVTDPAIDEEIPDDWFYEEETTTGVPVSQGYTIDVPPEEDNGQIYITPGWDPSSGEEPPTVSLIPPTEAVEL